MAPSDQDPRLKEAYSLMAASLMAKVDQAERRSQDPPRPTGIPWERYAMGLLSVLFSLLSVLFWDAKQDLDELRRTHDRLSPTMAYVESLRSVLEERNLRLALQEQKLLVLDAQLQNRLATMTQRILMINTRLDLLNVPAAPRTGPEGWDGPVP